ncbi:sensor histidine kinase [Brevibacillus laterosporus]|uniref:sensor histidine kinase n=1 Tax=Brevibacillus laterosporus TaxID=1465 RepID=UPI000CE4E339|nr:HAMP domain-containing sensor histidine kinase [Brevibacillus laterosporus]MED1665232.1 HAMP domain-containing sensor histidine kinase [Brevibacillus laterosporus]MED1670187.1 HAMP domain-containing sensor histidine kinase [Brevibacillus laterosporus]MED1718166.1 HAMP domain-containing sensor histidine kinase [Brevibacillus laterosporus]PPA88156.1 histidine kinase [Brevibacillus laterosporus]
MDTKSKGKFIPLVALIVSFYLLALPFLATIDILNNKPQLSKDYYFTTNNFGGDVDRFSDLLVRRFVEFKDYEKKPFAEQDEAFKRIKFRLSILDNTFHYHIQDQQTKDIYKNIDKFPTEEELKTKTLFYTRFPMLNPPDNLSDVNDLFKHFDWWGYIMVPLTLNEENLELKYYTAFLSTRDRLINECLVGLASLIGIISIGIYLFKQKSISVLLLEKMARVLRRIPIDIRIFLLGIVCITTIISLNQTSFFYLQPGIVHVLVLTGFALLFAYITLHIYEACHLLNNREQLQLQWQKSFLHQLKILYQDSTLYKSLLFKVVLLAILSAGFGFSCLLIFWGMVDNRDIPVIWGFFYSMLYLLFVVPLTLRRIGTLNKIMKATEYMAAGQLSLHIEEPKAGNFKELVENLNNMREGLKKSLDSQMKSEKLKTELITNVSHDLRTPLTSIMNYVGFLKQDTLTPEESKEYINILDKKTHRLKVLIDDLIEASKVASGAVEMHVEQVDIVALLNQALAEFTDKIPASGLTFRLHVEPPKMLVHVDGKKTWRVFENLISNAIKYSLPNTRVYLSLHEEADRVLFTVKNVSAYEINFEISELFERFKRGDQSRHTEGSGLGLAIAKSIMDLQGGELHIDIDGDYFKVMAIFPKQAMHEVKSQS